MFQFYATGHGRAHRPVRGRRLIHHAVTTDTPQLRYSVSWAGPEFIAARDAMTDEEWVALGAHADDADYYAAFKSTFGLDIAPA